MTDLASLQWIASKQQPIPTGKPGETLWVKLGWASFEWTWHEEHEVWAAAAWGPDRQMESVSPGAQRRDMSWARPA